MKPFMPPEMKVVLLANENVFCSSPDCPQNCPVFYCDDCVECSGKFNCFNFNCNPSKYNGIG